MWSRGAVEGANSVNEWPRSEPYVTKRRTEKKPLGMRDEARFGLANRSSRCGPYSVTVLPLFR